MYILFCLSYRFSLVIGIKSALCTYVHCLCTLCIHCLYIFLYFHQSPLCAAGLTEDKNILKQCNKKKMLSIILFRSTTYDLECKLRYYFWSAFTPNLHLKCNVLLGNSWCACTGPVCWHAKDENTIGLRFS